MSKSRLIASTGAALVSALLVAGLNPAAAKPNPEPVAKSAQAAESADAATERRRYCLVETITGSMIPRKTCKTRAEWEAEGATINYPKQ